MSNSRLTAKITLRERLTWLFAALLFPGLTLLSFALPGRRGMSPNYSPRIEIFWADLAYIRENFGIVLPCLLVYVVIAVMAGPVVLRRSLERIRPKRR